MNWLKDVKEGLKDIEILVTDKPFLKDLLTETIESQVEFGDFDSLVENVQTIFGSEAPIMLTLLNSRSESSFYDICLDMGFSEPFTLWIWNLSLKYGNIIHTMLMRNSTRNLEIEGFSSRIILDSDEMIEFKFRRVDGESFIIQSRLEKSLYLISKLASGINSYFTEDDLTEDEIDIISRTINTLAEIMGEAHLIDN